MYIKIWNTESYPNMEVFVTLICEPEQTIKHCKKNNKSKLEYEIKS
jgi:hypothetical protein